MRIKSLLTTYVSAGSRLEFSLVTDCASLVPTTRGTAVDLDSLTTRYTYNYTDPTTLATVEVETDIDQWTNILLYLPESIEFEVPATDALRYTDVESPLQINFNLESNVIEKYWIRAKVPMSNKDIFTGLEPVANPDLAAPLTDSYLENLGIETKPEVWYKSNGNDAVQIPEDDLTFEYALGKEGNSYFQ